MIAIILFIIFLLIGWITLSLSLSDSNSIQMILSVVMGLTAVNIVSSAIVIHKLDCLHNKIKSNDNIEQKDDKDQSDGSVIDD